MDAFWIWNPFLASPAPPTIQLFVTHGEASELDAGTTAFMTDVLSAIGVHQPPVGWRFERYRTGYFTDYPDSPEWEGRWALAWRASLEVAAVPGDLPAERELGLDSCDESWRSTSDPSRAPSSRCLLLADFEDRAALVAARAAVEQLAPSAEITEGLALGRYPQLQIDLGERPREFYAGGAKEALPILDECERLGASLRYVESARRLRDARP